MSTQVHARRRAGSPSPWRGFVRRHPLLAFFLWFFTVGQALAFTPVVLDAAGLQVPPQPFIIGATLIGLLLPAVVITGVVDGPDAVRALWADAFRFRVAWRWYVLALVGVPAASLAVTAAFLGLPQDLSAGTIAGALTAGFALQLALTFLPNNWWEEVAWMGFVQSRLEREHRVVVAAAITAVLFALQHVALTVGNPLPSAVLILGLLAVLAFPFRLLASWTYRRTGSLFVVGLMHAAGNAAAGGSGFGEGMLPRLYPDRGTLPLVAHLLAFALLGIVATVLLLRSERRRAEA